MFVTLRKRHYVEWQILIVNGSRRFKKQKDMNKTFNQLQVRDNLYRGVNPEDGRQITQIEINPKTGAKTFFFWETDKIMNIQHEDRLEVTEPNLHSSVVMRAGKGCFFASREDAVTLRIQYLQNEIEKLALIIEEKPTFGSDLARIIGDQQRC